MIVVNYEVVFISAGRMGGDKMRMPGGEIVMTMRNDFRILRRPEQESSNRSDTCHD